MKEISGYVEKHDQGIQRLADKMFYFLGNLQQIRFPPFDVRTAIDVLTSGTYHGLPAMIDVILFRIDVLFKEGCVEYRLQTFIRRGTSANLERRDGMDVKEAVIVSIECKGKKVHTNRYCRVFM